MGWSTGWPTRSLGNAVLMAPRLDGDGGLLPALAAAAQQRVRSRPSGPVRIVLTYDPNTQQITAEYKPGTTLATVRDACLGIALQAGDLHPAVQVHRDGVLFRCG